MKFVFFHNPDEENGYLSNWYLSRFIVDNVEFSSLEQYMMYQKAICFKDISIASQILATSDVATIKSLGRAVSNYDDNVWSAIREKIVHTGLIAKFSQNSDLKRQLLDTGDSLLAECAKNELIWGIGVSMKDPNRFDTRKWRGKNLLGSTLMKVREKLREK